MDHGAYEGAKNDLGEPQGKGRMQYASGHTYEGDWKNGCCDGNGKFTFPDGQEYEGQWKAGKRHGRGVLQLPNGDKMEGEWEHGEFLARGERPPANLLPSFKDEKEPPKPPIGETLHDTYHLRTAGFAATSREANGDRIRIDTVKREDIPFSRIGRDVRSPNRVRGYADYVNRYEPDSVSSRSIVSANERAMKAEKALADLKRELYEAKKFPLGKGLALPATVVSIDYPPDEPFICVTVLGGCNCLFSGKHDSKRTSLRILVKHEVPPWVQTLDQENKTMANEVGFASWQETPWIEVKGVLWSAQEFDKEWDKESGMWKLFFKYAMKHDDGEYGALL